MRGKKAGVRPSAFATDIERTITGNLKRFISLFVITALGATMLVGLKAACDDLRFTADDYYDAQRLFDISVKSTLGLDEADISALGEVQIVSVSHDNETFIPTQGTVLAAGDIIYAAVATSASRKFKQMLGITD